MKLPRINLKDIGKPKESKLFLALLPAFQQKRTQQFTSLSLTLVTIAFFGLFAISPTLGTIADLQKQLDDRNFVNTQLQNKIADLTSLQTQYVQIQPDLAPVFATIPTTSELDTFVGQIHQLAVTTNVQLNRVQTLPYEITPSAMTGTTAISYAFSIEAQGSLKSLESFVDQFGSFNRLVVFSTVSYVRSGRLVEIFRASVRGSTYFLPGGSL